MNTSYDASLHWAKQDLSLFTSAWHEKLASTSPQPEITQQDIEIYNYFMK